MSAGLLSSQSQAAFGIEHSDNGILIELSESTREAIDSGVSLSFICEFAVLEDWWFLKLRRQRHQHKFVISRHSLSDRYLVHSDNKATPAIFRSSSQGVAFIDKSIRNIFSGYTQDTPAMQLRVSLNKYDLPAPIRLTAFTSAQWNFDSGWGKWQSVN